MPSTGSLRRARLAAGLTQADLARLANCSRQWVKELERGYRPEPGRSPALRRLVNALAALGHPVEPNREES